MSLVLRGGTLIDGTGADPVADPVMVVEGELLARVGRGAPLPAGAAVLDCQGLTLLPGLIDAHSHLGIVSIGAPERVPPAMLAAQVFDNCARALDAGFTTVRDVGGLDGGVAQAVASGLVRGPRIFPSGPALCQTGGHGDLRPAFLDGHHHGGVAGISQLNLVCDGPDGVRQAARTAFRRGATQLKVIMSGGVVSLSDSLDDTQFTVAELRAAVEEAEARGTYVTAHAHNPRSIVNGLQAGVACFEHGTFLDAATAERMAAVGACLVPTFTVLREMSEHWRAWGVPEAVLPRLAGVEQAMAAATKLARDAGVAVGSGSDILGPAQERRGLELAIKAEVLGPLDAIVSATSVNARILRQNRRLGTLAPGLLADLIAVDGDPLTDPAVLADPDRVVLVVKAGQVVKDPHGRAPAPAARR
jgi:imidazolonepropionase-like amidohydrolase